MNAVAEIWEVFRLDDRGSIKLLNGHVLATLLVNDCCCCLGSILLSPQRLFSRQTSKHNCDVVRVQKRLAKQKPCS
ncbi:hypothetical protein ASPTUDRAFT_45152 [Aspergillus tubingensis CBS 134.48]|uniref:Uncharacterized protein n=1 Tax=Aspergillus tubingensis (strain CBS 134.48) TaxID=767770 RepID=A0A1L9MXU6_ASPTC|nr:hypothetical protein ASPTUDRAFT_45152 [Aspergillus tubingensis CBS 134.48]